MKRLPLHIVAFATLALGLAVTRPATAEQGCPDGYTMAAVGTAQCIPIPGLYQVPGGYQAPPPPPPVRWEQRWGAIAMDAVTGKVGVAGSRKSRQQAEDDSVAFCAKKGGGDCRVQVSYANQCGVIVWGNGIAVSRFAPTLEAATDMTLAECKRESGGACEVFFSDCSMPVRVQ
ncbi:DUF4189 domain-containing protein [Achromobacter xylosoxidans]|uniref:DUF4189 domain-containing protein n=1 Tax=Alcaligenes xylosoxydans xylosoxydans TaxID=85698 RepID=A0A1R1JK12_ALCXX|nr:DUF4189 domain-containing protein [Achromobacter xylosoxidans]OMG76111.1 hypothetical protein BIZ92_17630 [Achromobacter xylosoxidans]BEG75212.1 hypothetical protein HBIAX_02266 [Achromobacter xylosoxidans]